MYSQVWLAFFQVTSDKRRGNGLELCQGRFQWNIKKNLFTERVINYQNRLAKEAVESPSLEAFEESMWLRHLMTSLSGEHSRVGLMVELNDLQLLSKT